MAEVWQSIRTDRAEDEPSLPAVVRDRVLLRVRRATEFMADVAFRVVTGPPPEDGAPTRQLGDRHVSRFSGGMGSMTNLATRQVLEGDGSLEGNEVFVYGPEEGPNLQPPLYKEGDIS